MEVSNEPPIECIELAVDPRLGWYLLLEPGLALSALCVYFKTGSISTDLGNGYSDRDEGGDAGERLSTDSRGSQEAMITIINDRNTL